MRGARDGVITTRTQTNKQTHTHTRTHKHTHTHTRTHTQTHTHTHTHTQSTIRELQSLTRPRQSYNAIANLLFNDMLCTVYTDKDSVSPT